MTPFEIYHPLMSQNLIFDWPTTFPLKDVFQLQHNATLAAQKQRKPVNDITVTAKAINQVMRHIMQNKYFVWGIGHKPTKQLLGLVQLTPTQTTAQISLELLPTYQTAPLLKELLQRVGQLAFHEFKCTIMVITLHTTESVLAQLLLDQNFHQTVPGTYQFDLTTLKAR